MNKVENIIPFDNCPALDGYHCQSSSLRKIFHHYGHSLSEDMIFGLGAGMGFIYWMMKIGADDYVFIGGRGNNKNFFQDLGARVGTKMGLVSTSSAKKAESSLLEKLAKKEPVMLFGDMGFLPWFDFPVEYHFGGHTFVICGYDGKNTMLVSDIDPKATGLKKGFYSQITLGQLHKARNSVFKPFPPKNGFIELDFSHFHDPEPEDIHSSIMQTVNFQLKPPIKNLGIKGIRHTAKEILSWPRIFREYDLRMNLFTLYIFIEIGGTGGGCFRYMYSRFLRESAEITGNEKLLEASAKIQKAGELYSEIGYLFKEAEKCDDLSDRIKKASSLFLSIAEIEEDVFTKLSENIT
jgi:hypothetical protein